MTDANSPAEERARDARLESGRAFSSRRLCGELAASKDEDAFYRAAAFFSSGAP